MVRLRVRFDKPVGSDNVLRRKGTAALAGPTTNALPTAIDPIRRSKPRLRGIP